ncbi:two-component response regulator [Richelia intracellularis]|nr:two-component response regulator [Richelia intracellularis]
MASKIILIEDELRLAKFVEIELTCKGYQVSIAHDGITGISLGRESTHNLLILDWMLPGISGVEIYHRLRATGTQLPIIFLTAKYDVEFRLFGLDAGADDYIIKPFSIEELLARVRAHLRRNQKDERDLLQFEYCSLNCASHEVFRGKRPISLTAKEFDLLEYLIRNLPQVFSREQIMDKVWGYDFEDDYNVIEVYIRYFPMKIEKKNEKHLIHTIPGVGYVLREQ